MFPFSMIYGFIMELRNILYEANITKSSRFSVPIISVGNLTVGGAGKTPHVEYLVSLLKPYIDVATLSRGYNRKTKGFRFVYPQDDAATVGDEPLMYARKYKDIVVAVCEARAEAIPQMLQKYPGLHCIILDDAYQHRSIIPDLNILLTAYDMPFTRDFILPSGRLRERKASYERSDVIVVTKCPPFLSEEGRQALIKEINPYDYQKVFFSTYEYMNPYSFFDSSMRIELGDIKHMVVISAIANTSHLLNYLDSFQNEVITMEYEDHHYFTDYDIRQTRKHLDVLPEGKSVILTTEKDATRLALHYELIKELKIPLFVIPVKVGFLFGEGQKFDETVQKFLLEKVV